MFTANSLTALTEALGLSLPATARPSTPKSDRKRLVSRRLAT